MRHRVQEKIKAVALRMEGYTYKEIMEVIPVSKSVLSGWLKYIKLTDAQQKVLLEKVALRSINGREKAIASNRRRRLAREGVAYKQAEDLYKENKGDPIFISGISLYWAEGSKRSSSFQFMNSDPEMIIFMIFWAQKYLNIKKEDISLRVNTHMEFKDEGYEEYWAEVTRLKLSQFKKTFYKLNRHGAYKKNPIYKGCVRLEVKGGMHLLRVVTSLQKILNSDLKMLYSSL